MLPHPLKDAKARAVVWLAAWDAQGIHRTGTTGDEARGERAELGSLVTHRWRKADSNSQSRVASRYRAETAPMFVDNRAVLADHDTIA